MPQGIEMWRWVLPLHTIKFCRGAFWVVTKFDGANLQSTCQVAAWSNSKRQNSLWHSEHKL